MASIRAWFPWLRPHLTAATPQDVSSLQAPSPWLVAWAGGRTTTAGMPVSPQGAMALSTYYDCIRIISEDVGKLPLQVYERLDPRGKRLAREHPLYSLLHDAPNADMSAMTFRETLTQHMLGWGNGYAEILHTGRGQVAGLIPIHPSRVMLRRGDDDTLVYDVYGRDDLPGSMPTGRSRIPAYNMLHVHGLGPDGFTGYSIAQLAAESLGLSLAADKFGASFFGDDATPSGILTHPQRLSQQAQENLRKSWEERHQNSRKMAVLEEGMKFESMTIPPEQGQFIETRQFQVREICRWFRIPPTKVGDYEFATYSNIEHASIDYVVDTLTPWLVRWEQELKRKLFAEDETYFAEHQVQGLMRGDSGARSQFYKELFGMGALSPNDVRSLENMNSIGPQGETYWVASNNYTPIHQIVGNDSRPEEAESNAPPGFPRVPGRNGTNGHAKYAEERAS